MKGLYKKKEEKEEIKEVDIRGWIIKLEQNIESLDKRLDAVERRLSGEDIDLWKIKEETKIQKERRPFIFSEEKADIDYKKLEEIEKRIKNLERKGATVRVGKIEIPIEITGLVGGLLLLVTSILMFAGYKNMVSSPSFISALGIILLSVTILKTYIINLRK